MSINNEATIKKLGKKHKRIYISGESLSATVHSFNKIFK